MHKEIKEMVGMMKPGQMRQLGFAHGTLITDVLQKLDICTLYVTKYFDRDSNEYIEDTGSDIMREEIEYTLKYANNGKTNEHNEIPVELLKLTYEDSITIMLELLNTTYQTGILAKDGLHSIFVAIPKIDNTKECKIHHTVALSVTG